MKVFENDKERIKEAVMEEAKNFCDMIDAAIAKEQYHVFDGSCLTVCCLTLQNGFTVTGESACASPENFDADIGMEIARSNARDKIWGFEGYLLKQRLSEDKAPSEFD